MPTAAPALPQKFRIKKKPQGYSYGGVMYPATFPSVPEQHDGKPVVVDAGTTQRYILAQKLGFEELFAEARQYEGLHNTKTLCLSETDPCADYISTWQQFGGLTTPTLQTNDGKMVSRDRWLYNAVHRANPADLTDEQTTQLEHAAYWMRYGNPELRHTAANVVAYYLAAGHTTVFRRPYCKRQ